MKIFLHLFMVSLFLSIVPDLGCKPKGDTVTSNKKQKIMDIEKNGKSVAVLGAGCFWCVEALFQDVKGVISVESGYSGGQVENPTYEQVCTGLTGHAEVVKITFDSSVVSFERLLELFFQVHDPTTLNKQGADEGPQYRSVIFYENEEQRNTARKVAERAKEWWNDPIVTEISPLINYYAAENYHQDYFNLEGDKNPYCTIVVAPKLYKFRETFQSSLKDSVAEKVEQNKAKKKK